MATLVQDAFTRADSTTVPGSPTVGSAPTVRVGTWGINSNQMYTSASTADSVITWPTAADADLSVLVNNSGDKGLIHGWVDANNYWLYSYASNFVTLYRKVGGTLANRSMSIAKTGNATLRLVCRGRFLDCYIDGVLVFSCEDDLNPTTRAAVSGFRSNSNTNARFDDLLIVNSAALSTVTGQLPTLNPTPGGALASFTGHVLKGRDSKSLDTAAAA